MKHTSKEMADFFVSLEKSSGQVDVLIAFHRFAETLGDMRSVDRFPVMQAVIDKALYNLDFRTEFLKYGGAVVVSAPMTKDRKLDKKRLDEIEIEGAQGCI